MTDYLKRIERELRKLEATTAERPIARRNARRRVLSAMRVLRKVIDAEYPAIVDRTGVKRLKTFAGRLARAKKAGWRQIPGDHLAARDVANYVAAGVRVKKLEHTDDGDEARGRAGEHHVAWLVPAWAAAIGPQDVPALRRARRSVKARRSAVVAEALTE
ncbi:MAG TPA: hypothetical protein VGY48_15235 [Vicinamibacterales bacterium]|jgi:hypothetical protein|nr:hypothetical protein [Vicinamibacterales bacterium]